MMGHAQFEELSALAAIGQVTAEELVALNAHLSECSSCRRRSAEFAHIVHSELPLAHKESLSPFARLKHGLLANGYKQRFLDSAKSRGFSFSEELEQGKVLPSWRGIRAEHALIFALLIITVSATVVAIHTKHAYERVLANRSPELQQKISGGSESRESLKARIEEQTKIIAQTGSDLSVARAQLDAALKRVSSAEQVQHELSRAEVQRLKLALEAESVQSAELKGKLDSETQRASTLNDEIQRLNALRVTDDAQVAAQQQRADELSEQLRGQNEILSRERQLLAAGRDIRDMMGARNLHIIDVFDADLKGKNKKAFGRVFYTEGKSLIFYAFDLGNDKVVDAKYSFQAWGVRDGAGDPAKSLGIFYADDKAQRRWVLKIDDPYVLAQIDSVFVTVEPLGGVKKPTGQKLLYAYLKNQANHP